MTGKNQGGTAESFVPSKTSGFAFFVDIRAAREKRVARCLIGRMEDEYERKTSKN